MERLFYKHAFKWTAGLRSFHTCTQLRLVSTGEHDDNDISDLFDTSTRHAERRGKGRELEAGFKNTALSLYEDDSLGMTQQRLA
eukprot:1141749-Pelagomonas_calceolata.AAC.4